MKKSSVVAAILAELEREVTALQGLAAQSLDEATNSESKAENRYDTRALEASYLAAGQGERLQALEQLVAWFRVQEFGPSETVGLGALVCLESEQGPRWVFLAPSGGARVRVRGLDVQVVSPRAALGTALAGLRAGDEVEVGDTEYELAEVL